MRLKYKCTFISILFIYFFAIIEVKNQSFGTDLFLSKGDEGYFIYENINMNIDTKERDEITGSGDFETTINEKEKTTLTTGSETFELSTETLTGSGTYETTNTSINDVSTISTIKSTEITSDQVSTSSSTITLSDTTVSSIDETSISTDTTNPKSTEITSDQVSTSSSTITKSSTSSSSSPFPFFNTTKALSTSIFTSSINFTPTTSFSECKFTIDCSILGSFCLDGLCRCQVGFTTYNGSCIAPVPLPLVLPVLIPFNEVCDIIDSQPSDFTNSFVDVIDSNSKLFFNDAKDFLYTSINSISFAGDADSSLFKNICPPLNIRQKILQNRVDFTLTNSSNIFLERFEKCSNYNDLNFSIQDCFFPFDVEYSLILQNSSKITEQDLKDIGKNYSNQLIEKLSFNINNSLVFFQLNSSSSSFFLNVNQKKNYCNNESNCNDGPELLEGIKNYMKEFIDKTQNFSNSYETFTNILCNLDKDDCIFDNKKCEISTFSQKRCVCQNGYYEFNGISNDCIDCTKKCENSGICYNNNNIEYCYCSGFFLGDHCEINGLIIFVIGIVILILSFATCLLLWFCFIIRKIKKTKIVDQNLKNNSAPEETEIKQIDDNIEFDNDDFFETLEKPKRLNEEFDAEWDKFSVDDEINWDVIFGKDDDLNSIENSEETGAINPAFLTKSNLMIPRVNLNGHKDLFGTDISSTLKSQISLPGPTNFNDFKGIPRAWITEPTIEDYESDHSEAYF